MYNSPEKKVNPGVNGVSEASQSSARAAAGHPHSEPVVHSVATADSKGSKVQAADVKKDAAADDDEDSEEYYDEEGDDGDDV